MNQKPSGHREPRARPRSIKATLTRLSNACEIESACAAARACSRMISSLLPPAIFRVRFSSCFAIAALRCLRRGVAMGVVARSFFTGAGSRTDAFAGIATVRSNLFLDTAHVTDMLALLRFIENPHDRVAGFRLMQLLPGVARLLMRPCRLASTPRIGGLSSPPLVIACRARGVAGRIGARPSVVRAAP